MHELSMASSIVDAILSTAKKNDAIKINEAVLEIGEMTMLNPEQLRFMMEILSEDTLLKDAEIIINMIPIEIECESCGFKGESKTDENGDHLMAVARCPECENTQVHIIQGQECNVKTIKIEREDEDA
ncbi:MAG: hydrogenase maturation nickel metallochaperone HypA [Methanosphaera sp. SHI613]|jgi:hydrogenase nickel incorporation protein HypA/HybF|nr:hydrogenase maturation nickel metallochaperone HypA [Methanosphaera sp.]RAP49695.1 MAG: hydrogenase maturation nickel metallochaperone HypA [Methanosphaera sp. SHI613]